MAFRRRYWKKYYRRKYSKSRRYKALPLRSTKTFTVTLRNTINTSLDIEAGDTLSNVRCVTALQATNSDGAASANPLFSKLVQLFGEYKVNSLRMSMCPSTSVNQVTTIYTVADRKFLYAETKPSAATIGGSMTASTQMYTGASTTKVKRLLWAANITEKSTYIDSSNSMSAAATPFLPAFYIVGGVGAATTNISIPVSINLQCSITFRNPLY